MRLIIPFLFPCHTLLPTWLLAVSSVTLPHSWILVLNPDSFIRNMDNEKTPKMFLGGMLHWKLPRTQPHVCFSAHHGDKRFIDCSQPIWNPNMKTALWNSDRLFCFTSSRCRQEKKPGQFSFWLWTSKAVNTSLTNTYHILRAVPVQVWGVLQRRWGGGGGRAISWPGTSGPFWAKNKWNWKSEISPTSYLFLRTLNVYC